MGFPSYTNKNVPEILNALRTSETGLSEKEAGARQRIHGTNEIKTKEVGVLDVLLRQFKSPFFYLLFFAAAIYFAIGEIVNGLLILGFVLINVVLGFFQEYRAC